MAAKSSNDKLAPIPLKRPVVAGNVKIESVVFARYPLAGDLIDAEAQAANGKDNERAARLIAIISGIDYELVRQFSSPDFLAVAQRLGELTNAVPPVTSAGS